MERPSLLTIPPEIRENIYRLLLNPDANRLFASDGYTDYNYTDAFVLFKLNRQIHHEARRVFRDLNVFVRIQTPWPEAENHVAFEGHVPILMKGARAAKFREHSLSVMIDAPLTPVHGAEPQYFVILRDDLEKFTRSWYYADLSNMGLNGYLRLTLQLRDPYAPEWEEKRMPKWKQQDLLMPFRLIKGLGTMVVDGDLKPFDSVRKELLEEQRTPHRSPTACLIETTRLKLEGNKALNNEQYQDALKYYSQAWEAMHIVIKGRTRHVHADAFFDRYLSEAPFQGKHGQTERLVLRVQLVANTTLVYLKMKNWDEARFWGERTINVLRDAMGIDESEEVPPEQEAVLNSPAADQMGKIYFRTALAYKELGDKAQARKLLRVATLYLPNDQIIKKEIGACALQIG